MALGELTEAIKISVSDKINTSKIDHEKISRDLLYKSDAIICINKNKATLIKSRYGLISSEYLIMMLIKCLRNEIVNTDIPYFNEAVELELIESFQKIFTKYKSNIRGIKDCRSEVINRELEENSYKNIVERCKYEFRKITESY